jgi:predicted metal-dependent hydrolase
MPSLSQRLLHRLEAARLPLAPRKADPPRPVATIPVRNRRFDVANPSRPRDWHGAGLAVSLFFDNLSIFFPPGERFFMKTVKDFKDHAPPNSPLAAAVQAFLAQEAYHGREHRAYNARLDALGLPARALEDRVARLLGLVERVIPRRLQLAATCALEHYTASMGYQALVDARIFAGADPEFRALWKWHAVEENEHRAVAFDLFEAAGGTWPERVVAMLLATVIFWFKVAEQQVRLMHAAGIATDINAWRDLYRFMFVAPGNMGRLPRAVLTYLDPAFHPDQHDASAAIEAWRREAGEPVEARTAS